MSTDADVVAPTLIPRDRPARASMYRLRSETSDESGDLWELRWEALPPSTEPAIVRCTSRELFQRMDATGLLDSDVRISAGAIDALLGE